VTYVAPSKVLAHLDRLAAWQQGDTPAPVTVEIDLTNICSLGCQFCHFAHTHVGGPWADKPEKPAGYEDTGRFADAGLLMAAFTDMAEAGVRAVVFSGGGEPTLHPRFDDIVRAAAAAGLQLGMYTLGGHLSEARAALVRQTFAWVVVSLDAPDALAYATEKRVPAIRFQAAVDGIVRLSHGSCVVGVSFLLHAENWTRTYEMLALGRALGATYTTFRPTIETDPHDLAVATGDRSWVTDAWHVLHGLAAHPDVEIDPPRFAEYRDWHGRSYQTCYGIRLVTQVTPDGRVWVCPNRRGMPGSELGNLQTESFASIWRRHPGQWTDFSACRVMCRLHLVNETLDTVYKPRRHEAFI
jgi:MoaA/NifB/PqqE/SkfB family radical SAM enzyme